jgi:hypothetical protein
MNPHPKAKPDTKPAETNESEKNALSPNELDEIAGGRLSSDPCEGGQAKLR